MTHYTVRRGGQQVGTPTTTSFTDSGLTPETVYSYTVRSVDTAGQTSAQSAVLNVTTLPEIAARREPAVGTGQPVHHRPDHLQHHDRLGSVR